jgi:methylase of polypeptide subunit release factors
MTTRTTGAEWSAFYSDQSVWPNGVWHEDEILTVDGIEVRNPDFDNFAFNEADLSPTAKVTVSGGVVFLKSDANDGPTLEAYFKRWRKKQSTVFMTVEASKADAGKVQAAITAAGGKWKA